MSKVTQIPRQDLAFTGCVTLGHHLASLCFLSLLRKTGLAIAPELGLAPVRSRGGLFVLATLVQTPDLLPGVEGLWVQFVAEPALPFSSWLSYTSLAASRNLHRSSGGGIITLPYFWQVLPLTQKTERLYLQPNIKNNSFTHPAAMTLD